MCVCCEMLQHGIVRVSDVIEVYVNGMEIKS